ncbi:MAG: DUF917 domain-containing protein [Candidatus Dormibacteria bacterium]
MKLWLDENVLPSLAQGCGILGTGGGGDSSVGLMMALQAVGDYGPVPLVDLSELSDDALIMPCGSVGAPTVGIEKIDNGDEGDRLRARLEAIWGRPVAALMSSEIGGSNGLIPIVWAAHQGLPVVDADCIGRAFPELQHSTLELAGISPTPGVMTDERGNVVEFRTDTGVWLERLARAATVAFGGSASSTEYSLTAAQARGATVLGSVSLAIHIGTVISEAEEDPVSALIEALPAFRLIVGKVVDVERRTAQGFVRGSAVIGGLGSDRGRVIRIEIQNENLVVLEAGTVLASVPDLITVLDSVTGQAVPTERLRYGQRVTVVGFACASVWRTSAGLALAGPRPFGYDFDYVPVEELSRGRD